MTSRTPRESTRWRPPSAPRVSRRGRTGCPLQDLHFAASFFFKGLGMQRLPLSLPTASTLAGLAPLQLGLQKKPAAKKQGPAGWRAASVGLAFHSRLVAKLAVKPQDLPRLGAGRGRPVPPLLLCKTSCGAARPAEAGRQGRSHLGRGLTPVHTP